MVQQSLNNGNQPGWRRRCAFRLWMANILLGSLNGLGYLRHAAPVGELHVGLFLVLGLVSSVLLLSLLPALLQALTLRLVPPGRAPGWLAALLWTLFQAGLFLDTRIYGLFRYHFNGMVWNAISTPGAGDSVAVEWQAVVFFVLLVSAVLGAELLLWALFWRREKDRTPGNEPRWFARPRFIWCALLLPVVLLEKGTFAWADLYQDARVTSQARLLPLYQPLTVKRLARLHFDFDPGERPEVHVPREGLLLDYPKTMPKIAPHGPRPNILILVIDSLRRDALTPERMPRLSAWAEQARIFANHTSGGNGTRFGVFSLIYALHGTYWHPVYAENRPPVLLDVLLAEGYDPAVFSSTAMSFPEFRSTAWVRIEDKVHDKLAGTGKWQRDETLARELGTWLGQRAADAQPFFAFCLFDSPHMPYAFPPDLPGLLPCGEDLDYIELSGKADAAARRNVINRYWNAVSWSDELLGRVLSAVDELGLDENTWVIVTGDHGEELFEHGHVGHTSNFTASQVQVPFALRGPGITAGMEYGPTHHADLAPTILEYMGADAAVRHAWCQGENLFAPRADRRRVIATWNELAVWAPEGIVLISTRTHDGGIVFHDYDWSVIPEHRPWMESESARLSALTVELGRFLR